MEMCQYNDVLNKIYNIIRNDEKILKLLYYTTNVDIDDEVLCPKLTANQKKVVWSTYIKKISNINTTNDDSHAYISMEYRIVDFTNTKSRQRGMYQIHWGKCMFDIFVTVSKGIEELQGASRTLEIIYRIQELFSNIHIDSVGNSIPCGFSNNRTVDNYNSYVFTITFYDSNDSVIK